MQLWLLRFDEKGILFYASRSNNSNLTVARTSNLPYHALNDTYAQISEGRSLKSACDCISGD
ncbi:hypothetical protein [Edaphovirga cremea]|uniref:hypothetical protein n=1 Tax=Edaphovirga cremea TaxID=2267246 RepID=UPI0039893EF9